MERAFRFAGIRGDKRGGIQQLEIAAAQGRYLRPFAKILLALAALREKQPALARTQLAELVAEFPQNPLFASELAKLGASVVENKIGVRGGPWTTSPVPRGSGECFPKLG